MTDPVMPSGYENSHDVTAGDDDARDLEQALATLRPSAGGIDRDRLMFLAGKAVASSGIGGNAMAGSVVAGSVVAGGVMVGDATFGDASQSGGGSLWSQWLWPSATAVSALAATVFGLLLAISQRPLVVREKVYVHVPQPTDSSPLVHSGPPHGDEPRHGIVPFSMPGSDPMPMLVEQRSAIVVSESSPRQDVRENVVLVDYRPRSTLPPSNYLHTRQVALSLGVEALGSVTGARSARVQPLSNGARLSDLIPR